MAGQSEVGVVGWVGEHVGPISGRLQVSCATQPRRELAY